VLMKNLFAFLLVMIFTLGSLSTAAASQAGFDNSRSLDGVKKASVYFDVSLKDDELLVFRMDLLDRTIKMLEESGLEVSAVIGIRGHASRFITKDDNYVLDEQIDNKKKIQEWVKRLSEQGVVIEQCAIAADMLEISTDDFLPQVTIVGNGYISLVGYQAQGYSVVPMD
jgi:intracellular sulfur oxidation DsrE/DsrF family protein